MSAAFWSDAVPRVFGAGGLKGKPPLAPQKKADPQSEPEHHVVSFSKPKQIVHGPTSPAPPSTRKSPVESASIEILKN